MSSLATTARLSTAHEVNAATVRCCERADGILDQTVRFVVAVVIALSVKVYAGAFRAQAAGKGSPSEAAEGEQAGESSTLDGVIERYILNPRGKVEGLLLADGTQMSGTSRAADQMIRTFKPGDHVRVYGRRFPPDTNDDLRRSFHVGEGVTIRGNGTRNRFELAIEAVAIGRDPDSLTPLDASLHGLP